MVKLANLFLESVELSIPPVYNPRVVVCHDVDVVDNMGRRHAADGNSSEGDVPHMQIKNKSSPSGIVIRIVQCWAAAGSPRYAAAGWQKLR